MFKNKLIKKFFEHHFKNKSRHFFATHVKSVDFVITFLFNDTNQSIVNDEDEKNELIKLFDTLVLRSNTIIFFL